MACDCCREGAMHYSAVSVNQYTPPGNQPPVTQMSEGPSCCPHHDGHHVHTHGPAHHSQQHAHGSAHHSQQHAHGSAHHSQQHHAMAVSPYPAGHCPHQHSHGDITTTTTDDCYLCNSRGHHAHRHVPPVASPLGIAHTSHAPYSPPVFHTPQAVCRSHERCQCQQFLTPQQQQHHHHRLSLGYGSKPRRQLLASPVQQQQHHYHTPQQQQPQHSQALDHQSCHFSENVNYNASVGHTHSHNHAGIRHQPSSPLSAYGQPLPSSPQAGPLPPPPPPPSCLNQTGRRERFQLDFSPPCSHTPVAAMSRHHFQLAPTTLEYRVHPGGGGDTSSRQPVYSASTSSQVNSAPQLTSHHSQPPRLGDVHPHSIPAVPRPASILLPRPEVIIERLPHSVTKREVLSSSVDGSKSEAPSQADTSDNRDLMNEDPLGGLEKEPPGLTTKQPETVSVVPKTENGIPLEKCPATATATDTESEQTGDERKKSLRSSKHRPASTEGGAVKPSSPGRSRSSRTLRRRATPIVIDTTETESEAEIEPRRSSRKVYSLRSAQSEPASSVGQRVSRSRRGTDSEGTRTEEERVAANGQTDSDSEPSPRRRSQSAKSVRRLISDDEDDSASEVGGRGEVRRLQAEQQQVDSSPQLPAVVAVKGDPPTLEAGDVGEEDVSVDGTEDGGKPKGEGSRPVVLEGWYFRIVADGLVILEGTKENDKSGMKWHSGPVDRRQSARDLVTRSGTIYRLSGELNRELLSKVGGVDSKDIARRFRKGFPRDWAPLLQSYFEEQQEAELEKDDGAATVDQGDVNTEKKVKVKSEQDRLKTPMLDCSLANSDFLSSLKRSSRGRTLKPSTYSSMSSFLNLSSDLYSYDMHGSFQGISSPVIDLTVEGNFVVKPRQSKKRVKREKEFVSKVEEEGRTTESEDSSSHKLRSDAEETREDWKENTTPGAVRKSSEEDSEWNQKAEALQTSSVISAKTRSRRTRRIIPSKLTKRVKKMVSDVKLDSTSYSSSASQTQEEVVTVKRTTTKKSVRITQRSEKQSSSRGGSRRRGRVAEGRSEDEETETEVQSNSESQERPRGRGRPRKGAGSRGVAFSRVLADGTESDNSSIERVQKRGRGRPRKREQGVGRARESAVEERVQKRGRGRPRKWEQGVGRARECAAEDRDDPSSESNAPTEEWTLRDDPREVEEELQWTTEDFRDLKSIVHAVPAMTTNFWEVVARRLGTGHSARECSGQYLQITARDPKRRPKRAQERPRAAVTVAPPAITGKAGTMKRKRQLRSALEHMDRGYSDDIFDSTPFRKKMKHVELQELSDDECFHDDKKSEESKPIRTPSEAKRRLGAPTSHTPRLSDFLTTPDLKSGMRREAADNVIYKAQKAKKGPKKPLKKSAASLVPRGKRIVHEPLLRNIRTGEVTTIRMFEDSDDDSADSDPFSDIEDTYRDIITRLH